MNYWKKLDQMLSKLYTTVFFATSLMLIVVYRSIFAFEFPMLYAEDGIWVGEIITNGFWETVFNARKEFPVFGLVFLQWLSFFVLQLIEPSNISNLPTSNAVVSCVFITTISIFPYLFFREKIGKLNSIILGFLIVLLPTGHSGNEVFGRVLNLVWYFPILNLYLLMMILYSDLSKCWKIFCYTIIGFLIISFPLISVQFLVFIIFKISHMRKLDSDTLLDFSAFILLFGAVFVASLSGNVLGTGGINENINTGSFLEFAVARATLYPIIAAFYQSFTDIGTIIVLLIVLITLGIHHYKNWHSIHLNGIEYFTISNFGLGFAALVIMRPGLSSFFENYESTYPDRYFITTNILFLIMIAFNLRRWKKKTTVILIVTLITWVMVPGLYKSNVIVSEHTQLGLFDQILCAKLNGEYDQIIVDGVHNTILPIYPVTENFAWRMELPKSLYLSTVEQICE